MDGYEWHWVRVCYHGDTAVLEFKYCVMLGDLEETEQNSYKRCANLHVLEYEPSFTTPPSIDSLDTI